MKQKILLLCLNTLIFGIITGLVWGQFYKLDFIDSITGSLPSTTPTITPSTTPHVQDFTCEQCENNDFKKYFYTRIILFGQDEMQNPILIKLQLSRKQRNQSEYEHIYSAIAFMANKTEKTTDQFITNSNEIATRELFTQFEITRHGSQTTQEDYNLEFIVADTEYTVSIKDINGDFLIKDVPDYIRFMSEGTATATIDNKRYSLHAIVDRTISEDYSKSIFFEGRENLSHVTHSIALWDQEDEFYLIDFTESRSPQLPYESHKWVIHKDKKGYIKKIFDGELEFDKTEYDQPVSWNFFLPLLSNTSIQLEPEAITDSEQTMGTLTGKIQINNQIKQINGYFVYLNENP